MVVGKLLILLVFSSSVYAVQEPRFFEYRSSNNMVGRFLDVSFGWFKTLDNEQKSAYHQSVVHALMFAENGEAVTWYQNNASGVSVPVMTWPTGSGYCRRLHIQAIAHGVQKDLSRTACFDNTHSNWTWMTQ